MIKMRIIQIAPGRTMYSGGGMSMKRECGQVNDAYFRNHWVLRDLDGSLIDFDQCRENIAERNNLKLES